MRRKIANAVAYFGAVLLIAAAAFHATGAPMATAAATQLDNPFMQAALGPIWLFASNHWTLMALIAILVTIGDHGPLRRAVHGVIGISVIIDAAMMVAPLPGFIGLYVLAAAGLSLIVGALAAPPIRMISKTG